MADATHDRHVPHIGLDVRTAGAQEEREATATFGDTYRKYAERVPSFFPILFSAGARKA